MAQTLTQVLCLSLLTIARMQFCVRTHEWYLACRTMSKKLVAQLNSKLQIELGDIILFHFW